MLFWFCFWRKKATIVIFYFHVQNHRVICSCEYKSVLMPLSGSTSTDLLVHIFFILGLVLIRLDLRFCLWLYSLEANWMSKRTDRALTDIICKRIVWDVVLNFDLPISLIWKRVPLLVGRDFSQPDLIYGGI